MITPVIKVNELPPPWAHDSLLQSESSQNESRNRTVEAEFAKFVTTYDEAYRIIEKYENSSTSKLVLCRKNKEFGNEVKWHCIYSCFKNFLVVVCSTISVQFRSGFRDLLHLLLYSFVHLLM